MVGVRVVKQLEESFRSVTRPSSFIMVIGHAIGLTGERPARRGPSTVSQLLPTDYRSTDGARAPGHRRTGRRLARP